MEMTVGKYTISESKLEELLDHLADLTRHDDARLEKANELAEAVKESGLVIEYPNGHKEWWAHHLHRSDGPPIEYI